MKGETKIIEQVLSGLKRLHRANIDSLHVICRYVGLDIEKEEIEEALVFLSSPPLDIVKKEEGTYSLTIDFDEILKRLALLHEALPTLKPIRKSEQLGPNIYRRKLTKSDVQHKFIFIKTSMLSLFPEPGVDFIIESNGKTYTVSQDERNRIFSGMFKWYNNNPTVKEGDFILLERLRENVYRLTLEYHSVME